MARELADWKARREAEGAGAAWLTAWNGDGKDESADRREEALGKGRQLAADPAMPEELRRSLPGALAGHEAIQAERVERGAVRARAREAATAARREAADIALRLWSGSWSGDADAMDDLLARGERLAAGRHLSEAERQRLERTLERERDYRANLLRHSVQASDPEEAGFHALLSRAEAVRRDELDDAVVKPRAVRGRPASGTRAARRQR